LRTLGAWACTFLLVHIAWIFFRCQPVPLPGQAELEPTAAALSRAVYFTQHLFVSPKVAQPLWLMNKPAMSLLFGLMMTMQLYDEWLRRGKPGIRLPAPIAGVGYASWIAVLVIFSPDNTNPFIYFQF
jgi:hypothetical protein